LEIIARPIAAIWAGREKTAGRARIKYYARSKRYSRLDPGEAEVKPREFSRLGLS
jgi:hypothetical protein